MAAILFALLSAFGYGWTNVLMQLGLRDPRATPFRALVVNLVGGTAVLAVAVALLQGTKAVGLNIEGVVYFVCAGLAAALAGQAANFQAIRRIGATRTASLAMSENLFAAFLAFTILGQSVSPMTAVGIAILMVSTILFMQETNATMTRETAPLDRGGGWFRSVAAAGFGFALLSALSFAVAGVFRQLGVQAFPSAVAGAFIGNVAALILIVAGFAATRRLATILKVGRKALVMFLLSGLCSAVGTVSFVLALQLGATVAISTALKNTQPLFTFGLAALLLSRHERISLRLGMLVVLVVLGGVLTALGLF
jgi:uncharacterized membrane protein